MKKSDYEKLKEGDTVDYGFYTGLKFLGERRGRSGQIVVLEDKHGNQKEVFKCLFLDHGGIHE